MLNQHNDAVSEYYSGQGVVMLGKRDANGNPLGLRPLGNVSALSTTVDTTVVEHKNSQNGQRGVDARLQTETNATLTMTLDNWSRKNLALALRGDATYIPAGTVAAEAITLFGSLVTPLQHIGVNVTSVTRASDSTALVVYTDQFTPYDFTVDLDAGSIRGNDLSVQPPTLGHAVISAITVGQTTIVTVPNACVPGDNVVVFGAAGADAGVLNGVIAQVLSASATAITINVNTSGKTITVAGTTKLGGQGVSVNLQVNYTYSSQAQIDALTEPLQEYFLRFEGLNTANTNQPVVIEVFRFSNDPLKELALLSDNFGSFDITGSVLADSTKVVGSQYFRVRKLQ